MTHRPSTLTTLLLTRLGLSPNSTARASKLRARHLLAPFAIAAMLLGLAGNANAQQLSFGIDPSHRRPGLHRRPGGQRDPAE